MTISKTYPVTPQYLWNVYVPYTYYPHELTTLNDWVEEINPINTGLTVFENVLGLYKHEGKIIPDSIQVVQMISTHEQVAAFAQLIKSKLNQTSVMYYKVSEDLYFI